MSIRDSSELIINEQKGVEDKVVSYSKDLICPPSVSPPPVVSSQRINTICYLAKEDLVRVITNEEVKEVVFNIDKDKNPGPNGSYCHFSITWWHIIGPEVTKAILEFI